MSSTIMPGISIRIIQKGQSSDHATVGECRHEICLISQVPCSCPGLLSDTPSPRNPRRCPSEKIPDLRPKTGVPCPSGILQPVLEKILCPINAICFLVFTSEKSGKNGNYARFLANYARNPGPEHTTWAVFRSCYRRRVPGDTGRKRCLCSQAPPGSLPGLSDTPVPGQKSLQLFTIRKHFVHGT